MGNHLKFLRVLGVSCGLLLTVSPTWSQVGVEAPKVATQPMQIVPVPNALDYFVKASDAVVDKDALWDKLTLPQKQKIVVRNAEALRILREGFSYEYLLTSTAFDEAAMNYSANLRALARILIVEGQTHAALSDGQRAANSFLDAMRLGVDVTRGAPLIGALVGGAIESIGKRSIWEMIDQMDAATGRQTARRLEVIESRRPTFVETLLSEQIVGEAMLRDEAQRINHPASNEQKMLEEYSKFMEAEIAAARLPYTTSKQPVATAAEVAQTAEEHARVSEARDANTMESFFKMNKSSINSTQFIVAKSQAQNALLTVALALRAYKLEHGSYPALLSQLVPDYLEQVPTDPFSLKKPLLYKLKEDAYVLYSIGPDGADDLGSAIANAKSKNVQPESKGDIVAGVNQR
jgi:hypothetical protein